MGGPPKSSGRAGGAEWRDHSRGSLPSLSALGRRISVLAARMGFAVCSLPVAKGAETLHSVDSASEPLTSVGSAALPTAARRPCALRWTWSLSTTSSLRHLLRNYCLALLSPRPTKCRALLAQRRASPAIGRESGRGRRAGAQKVSWAKLGLRRQLWRLNWADRRSARLGCANRASFGGASGNRTG